MRQRRTITSILSAMLLVGAGAASASETVTYSYDALGRLTATVVAGGPNDGTQVTTGFDPAGNRTVYAVAGGNGGTSTFSINSVSAVEGNALVFTVTKSGTATGSVSITYATSDGSATSPADYTATSGTLTFAPSETSKTISIPTVDDTLVEGDETFSLTLSGAPARSTIATAVGTGTITDNDTPAPSFAITSAGAVTEGGTLAFTVSKTGTTASSYSVNYASADGTATSGADYGATSGTLTFAPSETSKTVSVATYDDTIVEPSETVLMTLSSPTGGATLGTAQATGTINDNDVAPSFAISNAAAVTEGGSLVYTVTRTGAATGTYTVNFATANGTATAGSDYTAKSDTLTFLSGETIKTITVSTIDDTVEEPAETVLVNLSGASGGAAITTAQGSGTINDNDGYITIADGNLNVTAGNESTYTCNAFQNADDLIRYCTLNSNGARVYYDDNGTVMEIKQGYRRYGDVLQVLQSYYGTAQ